ncbi:MAG: hypothetical protein R6V83_10630 [Candidatus Thorarchaeota archaeon]
MDYETLNKVRKAGVVGSILSAVNALNIYDGTTYSVELIWPSTYEQWGTLPYDIRDIGSAGCLHLMVGILVALALFVSIIEYSNKLSKTFSALGAIASLISVVLMVQWLIPYTDVWITVEYEIPITPPQLLNLETLMVQGFTAAFLSVVLAGLAGIFERGSDKVANAGYVLSLIGGLVAIIYGLVTGGLFVSTYGDGVFVLISYIIAVSGYIGLGAAFYRPITQSKKHPDIQEQGEDSEE